MCKTIYGYGQSNYMDMCKAIYMDMYKAIYEYVQSNIWEPLYEDYYCGCLRINS